MDRWGGVPACPDNLAAAPLADPSPPSHLWSGPPSSLRPPAPHVALFLLSPRLLSPTWLKSGHRKTKHLSIWGCIAEKEGFALSFASYFGENSTDRKEWFMPRRTSITLFFFLLMFSLWWKNCWTRKRNPGSWSHFFPLPFFSSWVILVDWPTSSLRRGRMLKGWGGNMRMYTRGLQNNFPTWNNDTETANNILKKIPGCLHWIGLEK